MLASVFETTSHNTTASGSAEGTEGSATPYMKESLLTRSNKRARTNEKTGDLDNSLSE